MRFEDACEHTDVDCRGICGFCGKEEGGYAKQDAKGEWKAACWNCIKPEPQPPQKRQPVGRVVYEDLDTESALAAKAKKPGMAPSTHRPHVS